MKLFYRFELLMVLEQFEKGLKGFRVSYSFIPTHLTVKTFGELVRVKF